MTPPRTQNEIAMAVLPALDRQAPLDRDQFLELFQTNALGLWE
jgi:hypothetical protein